MQIRPIDHEIYEILKGSSALYFRTVTNGTAGQGDTLESKVFGMVRNNKKGADFKGLVELKTCTVGKKDFRPITCKGGYESLLQANWGSLSRKDQTRCFNIGFAAAKKKTIRKGTPQQVDTELVLEDDAARLYFGEEITGVWNRDEVTQRLIDKIADLCIVEAKKSVRGEDTYYNYNDFTIYRGFNANSFWTLFQQGLVTIEFRVRGDKDKGTCFRMKRCHLPLIYDSVLTRDAYETIVCAEAD